MNNVSIKLQGGLGNYMFQIACAYAYSLKYQKELNFDFKNSIQIHNSISCYKDNIFKKVFGFEHDKNIKYDKFITQEGFHYIPLQYYEGNVSFIGYYQSQKFFEEYTKEIAELFSCPEELNIKIKSKYANLLNHEKTCSIHVRRKNYLQLTEYHPVQGLNYYMKAIRRMGMDSLFLIFSDDPEWCKQNFPQLENFIVIEGQSDYEDFFLLSFCKNHIIANSSFSWWGAWLSESNSKSNSKSDSNSESNNKSDSKSENRNDTNGENNNKSGSNSPRIISPSHWFGSAYADWDTSDLYPEGWEKI